MRRLIQSTVNRLRETSGAATLASAVRVSVLVGLALGLSAGCGSDEEVGPTIITVDAVADGGFGGDVAPVDGNGAQDASTAQDTALRSASDSVATISDTAQDSGSKDSGGLVDAAPADTANSDAGAVDAGVTDSGPADTGTPDTGAKDSGPADTGTPDTGTPDTGTADTGVADTGLADTQPANSCGDLQCTGNETAKSCPFDCSTTGGQVWACAKSSCASQTQKCQGSPACVSAIGAGLSCADACTTLSTTCITQCQSALGANSDALSLMSCAITKGCITAPGPVCGDGTCDSNETPLTCGLDCKTVCGDGKCELPESQLTCAKDCAPKFPPCGDGKCGANEDAKTCAFDCDPAIAKVYSCVKGKCPSQTAKCLKEPACQSAVAAGVTCTLSCKKSDFGCLGACGAKTAGNTAATALVSCGLSCFL
ncbi:MAG: hypothetical protein KC502_16335 [Myxococcales bacterium]|nr:hypothetical protein [Myxococcales bacterium]